MADPRPDYWPWVALGGPPDVAGCGPAAILGDADAAGAVWDYALEHWEAGVCPFVVGETYLIQTVTLYWVGRVARVAGAFVELEEASWVHWTGRLSVLAARGEFAGFPAGVQKPRTEYVGRSVGINMASIVDYLTGPFELPTKNVP